MFLETLHLVNIKSFSDATLQFSRGINIISGMNGAGKSTVIEAIGIALFDCWPAKFKDGNARTGFIRRNETEGRIELTVSVRGTSYRIECSLGERRRRGKEPVTEYERVLFDSGGRQLSASSGRKEEFQDDIRRHIIGASRIEDDKLFENIIGTAQGAFDEPFTAPESERRRLFERILGVEDFQRFERQFAVFVRFLKNRSERLHSNASMLADAAQELENTKAGLVERTAAAELRKQECESARSAREHSQSGFEQLNRIREQIESLRTRRSQLEEHSRTVAVSLGQNRAALTQAQDAESEMLKHKDGFDAYNAAESSLIELRRKAEDRTVLIEKIRERTGRHETLISTLEAKRQSAAEREEQIRSEIGGYNEEERDLNERRLALLTESESAKHHHDRLLQEERFILRIDRYVAELIGVQKALVDSDSAIRELRDTLAAIERDAASFLEHGAAFVSRDAIEALRIESAELFKLVITELDHHLQKRDMSSVSATVKSALENARNAVNAADQRKSEIKTKGESVKEEIEKTVRYRNAKENDLKYFLNEIASYDNKREAEDADWNAFRGKMDAELNAFDGLDESIASFEETKLRYKTSFETYLHVRSDAARVEERLALVKAAEDRQTEIARQHASANEELAILEPDFSMDLYEQAKKEYEHAAVAESAGITALSVADTLVAEQQRRLSEAQQRAALYMSQRETAERSTAEASFFESVLKEVIHGLAQRIGAGIVSSVSEYANRLYLRIAPGQAAALSWDPMTYGIELHTEQGVIRGKELSGGQSMGVSLAIKLALIKWYSHCRIGFLDEPTTHLDKDTRRHLSEVLMNLESIASDAAWFDQLFVISHEEALYGAGHRIELERKTGASIVAGID